jgi:hypothetical protein
MFAALMSLFLIKHFIADFPLQTQWMVQGKARRNWPLLAHAGVHAAFTALIVLPLAPQLLWLAAVEWLAHIIVDKLKVDVSRGWHPGQPKFWWALGADQLAHGLCYVLICQALVSALT